MRRTLATLTVSLTVLVVSAGCGDVKMREGAVMRDGVLREGVHFKEPVIKVEPGAVEVKPGSFVGPAIKVEPKAVNLQVEQGAVQFHENAININLIGKKSPYIETKDVKERLEALKNLEGLEQVPEGLRDRILSNEEVYQGAIEALVEMINQYNRKHAVEPKEEE